MTQSPQRPHGPAGWWGQRGRSFRCAFHGLAISLRTQAHARLHAVATVAVVGLGWMLHLAPWEWCVVSIAVGLVWMAETFNTALELLVDLVSPEQHPQAGRIKDLAAGAVLAAALGALTVGL